jgi:hypothetical protein
LVVSIGPEIRKPAEKSVPIKVPQWRRVSGRWLLGAIFDVVKVSL